MLAGEESGTTCKKGECVRVDVEVILEALGSPGRFQMVQMTLTVFASLLFAIPLLDTVFLGFQPYHRCSELNATQIENHLSNDVTNFTLHDVTYKQCAIDVTINISDITFTRSLPCLSGVNFSVPQHTSYVTEWSLVCDKAGLVHATQTALFAGQVVGSAVFSPLADHCGRRKVYTGTALCMTAAVFSMLLVPSYYWFLAAKAAVGCFGVGMSTSGYTLLMEWIPARWRGLAGVMDSVLWCGGCLLVACAGYLLQGLSWRLCGLAFYCPFALCLLLPCFLDESVRWLVATGKVEEAEKVLEKACRMNGKDFPRIKAMLRNEGAHVDNIDTDCTKQSEIDFVKGNESRLKKENNNSVSKLNETDFTKQDKLAFKEHKNRSFSKKNETDFTQINKHKFKSSDEEVKNITVNCTEEKHFIADMSSKEKRNKTDISIEEKHNIAFKTGMDGLIVTSVSAVESDATDETSRFLVVGGCGDSRVEETLTLVDDNVGIRSNVTDESAQCLGVNGGGGGDDGRTEGTSSDRTGLKVQTEAFSATYTVLDLFRHRVVLVPFLVISLVWMSNNLYFYALMLGSARLSGNRFLNFALLSLQDIPSIVVCHVLISRFNRRPLAFLYGACSGAALLVSSTLIALGGGEGVTLTLATVAQYCGKFCLCGSLIMLFVYCMEVFPTGMRSIGIGAATLLSNIADVQAPFLLLWAERTPWAPGILLGCLLCLASTSIWLLPETRHRKLPDSIAEVKAWRKKKLVYPAFTG